MMMMITNNPSYSSDCSPQWDFSGQLTWHKDGAIIWMVVRGLSTINNKIFDHRQYPCNHTLADNQLHYHYYHKNYSYLLIITIMIIYYNNYHCSFFPYRIITWHQNLLCVRLKSHFKSSLMNSILSFHSSTAAWSTSEEDRGGGV